jgi:5-methylcytosine-specific restriction endonuclease McrA
MPTAPKRPCCQSGCAGFAVNAGYCDHHQTKIKQVDRQRGTSHQRGYDSRWRKARLLFLELHPLCIKCSNDDHRVVAATVVDHILPHKGDQHLFWSQSNWQSLCKSHHDQKTATEDRGSWSFDRNSEK